MAFTKTTHQAGLVYKNNTIIARLFSQNVYSSVRRVVHKNETTAEAPIDTLPPAVRFIAHTASIHTPTCFLPGVDDAEVEPNS